ncbi:MAG: Maf family protein [bacterium]|nr:Maf family protein [bacterium]
MNNTEKILNQPYVLASQSPRRIQLLRQIGLNFISVDSNITELDDRDHNPLKLVKYNALSKSRKVALDYKKEIVIGADTVVSMDGKIFNKPKDQEEAKRFLRKLSNKKHTVYTGINVINIKNGKEIFDYEKTVVHFRKLSEDEITYYVEKYDPLDKAGAYGIQDGFGCLFIEKILGDYYNIMGMPLLRLYKTLGKIV